MFINLDIGTSGTKATLVDKDGTIIQSSIRKYFLKGLEENYRELDVSEIWRAIKSVIGELIKQTGKDQIQAIIVTTLGEAIVPVDKTGKALMRSIVGSDQRGAQEFEWLCSQISPVEMTSITGLNVGAIYSLNKILFIKRKFPEIYNQTHKFYCIIDYIIHKFTGESVIDYSLASRTMAFDINTYTWSEKILGKAGISPDYFSQPVLAGTIAGKINQKIAESFGLSPDTFVLAGPHDHINNALGVGAIRPGVGSNITGTTEGITAVIGSQKLSTEAISGRNISCQPFVEKGVFNTVSWHNTSGVLVEWFLNLFCPSSGRSQQKKRLLDQLTQSYRGEPTRLMLQPQFSGATTTVMDPQARGGIVGLSLSTTREELFQAILEGTAYECRVILEGMLKSGIHVDEIVANGGGSKSPAWLSIKANILGQPIHTVTQTESSAIGGAMLCARAFDKNVTFSDLAQVMIKKGKTYYPDEKYLRIYDERYLEYKELYSRMRSINHLLQKDFPD